MPPSCQRLSRLREGARGVIDAVPFDSGADDFAALRLLPGELLEVIQVIPLGGPVLIRCRGGFYALGRQVADKIWIRV